MASANPISLERYISFHLLLLSTIIVSLVAALCWFYAVPVAWNIIACLFVIVMLARFILSFRRKVLQAFNRATLHLDAIANEDYNQFAKSSFREGKVAEFHQQLRQLSEYLQHQKSRYDQHAFLVYQLIAQLDTPVLVFNQKQQLTSSNDAFEHLFGQPWQVYRHFTPERLGLTLLRGNWGFKDSGKQSKWQIRHSDFINEGQTYQLFVCINIESALRKHQLEAWQQLIRVLSHEIRNSLTPVSSMAESLADRSKSPREKQALTVITERCQHLQRFVERYSSLSQKYALCCGWINASELVQAITTLFKGEHEQGKALSFELDLAVERFWGDANFLEQVLINLIKNAYEAEASKVSIALTDQEAFTIIEISDDGHGFANLDNVFVPLYTTKTDGQGIGLNFCRNVVEQHNGVLEMTNNEQGGATAMIILPHSTHAA
ncbi:sensor histidine kinase [Thalassotalea fusca]